MKRYLHIQKQQQQKCLNGTTDIQGGPEKKTKAVHIFKLYLEVGSTRANQDDYFNMEGMG